MHLDRPNSEILAVLPTIESPHFTTVTFLAWNTDIDFDYPSHKYWRRIDEVLTFLGENLVKYKRKLEVVFNRWTALALTSLFERPSLTTGIEQQTDAGII